MALFLGDESVFSMVQTFVSPGMILGNCHPKIDCGQWPAKQAHKLDSPLSLYVHFCLHIHVFCPFHPEGSQNKTKFSVEFCPHGPQLTAAWTSTSSAMVESKSERTHVLTAFYTWGMSYPVKEVNAIKIPIFNIFLHSCCKFLRIERNFLKVTVTATILPRRQC